MWRLHKLNTWKKLLAQPKGKRGLVGMHEVNTCGRCHIRVYYRL